jgi:hypothetical protein
VTLDNVTGLSQPLTVIDVIENIRIVSDAQVNGKVTLSQPLDQAFPLTGSYVSNAIPHEDIYAKVGNIFDQSSWDAITWLGYQSGNGATSTLNTATYPIVVNNHDAITERWAVRFVSSTLVDVYGEHTGLVLDNVPINADIAPTNPLTGNPYFTIPTAAFGGGWASGNTIFFETTGAFVPIWVLESVGQGAATDTSADALQFRYALRGAVNA